jgi:hypothetical protein
VFTFDPFSTDLRWKPPVSKRNRAEKGPKMEHFRNFWRFLLLLALFFRFFWGCQKWARSEASLVCFRPRFSFDSPGAPTPLRGVGRQREPRLKSKHFWPLLALQSRLTAFLRSTHTPLPAVVPWVVPAPKSVYRVPVSPVVPVGKYP